MNGIYIELETEKITKVIKKEKTVNGKVSISFLPITDEDSSELILLDDSEVPVYFTETIKKWFDEGIKVWTMMEQYMVPTFANEHDEVCVRVKDVINLLARLRVSGVVEVGVDPSLDLGNSDDAEEFYALDEDFGYMDEDDEEA